MIYETEVALPKLWGFGLQFILMVEGQLEHRASVHIQVAHHSSAEQQVLHSRSQLRAAREKVTNSRAGSRGRGRGDTFINILILLLLMLR